MATAAKRRKRNAPMSEYFTIRATRGARKIVGAPITQKREAIREAKRRLHKLGGGARAEVRTKEGQLVYQGKLWFIPNTNRLTVKDLEL